MDPLEHITRKITEITGIASEESHFLLSQLTEASFEKGEYISRAGEVQSYLYFLQEGIIRSVFEREHKEYTLDFHFENEFFTSFISFITREPSRTSLQALTRVKAYRVHRDRIYELYERFPASQKIGRIMAEQQFIRRANKEIDLVSMPAAERYQLLFQRNPKLISQISVRHLSSYLGIHPESLSRIRKESSGLS